MASFLPKCPEHLQLRGKTLPNIFLAIWLGTLKHPSQSTQWNCRVKLPIHSPAYPPVHGLWDFFYISHYGENNITKKVDLLIYFFLFLEQQSHTVRDMTCLTWVDSFCLSPSRFWSTASSYLGLFCPSGASAFIFVSAASMIFPEVSVDETFGFVQLPFSLS